MKISIFYDHLLEAAQQRTESVADIMAEARKAGICGLEINLTCLLEQEALVRELLEKQDMQISCIYEFFDWGNQTDISYGKKQVDMAKEMGAEKILVVPGFLSEEEAVELEKAGKEKESLYQFMNQNEKVQRMKVALQELVAYADTQGITVTMEDFDSANAPYATIYQLSWFMEQVDGLRFTMDTGNFAYSDEDAYEGFQQLKARMVHLHCKDRGMEPHMEAFRYKRGMATCATGSGYLPIQKIIREAMEEGYHGYYAIEHFGAENQMETMRQSAAFLKGVAI